jgi:hypothetical protein
MHILLGDVVAKTGDQTGPMDVLEQAVVALVGCIEILADAVDVLQARIEASAPPQLAVAPDPAPDPVDFQTELANLTRQIGDLTKTVKKLRKRKK